MAAAKRSRLAEPRIAELLDFWQAAGPEQWFTKDAAFDTAFRQRFLELHYAAARRELDGWAADASGALALVLLLDQLPRNAFRGTGHMYATDPLALQFAHAAIAAGHDQRVDPGLKVFFYLPFAHAEDPVCQELSVGLTRGLGGEYAQHALGHRAIIRRFGRFPHRNAILGRSTTAEEAEYLAAGGFAG